MPPRRRRSSLDRGEWLFVEDEREAWVLGRVEGRGAGTVTVRVGSEARTVKLKKDGSNVSEAGTGLNVNVENLVDLDSFTEGSILHHVRKRFMGDDIYTLVGSILVAVNPFKRLAIYGDEQARAPALGVWVGPPVVNAGRSGAAAMPRRRRGSTPRAVLAVDARGGAGDRRGSRRRCGAAEESSRRRPDVCRASARRRGGKDTTPNLRSTRTALGRRRGRRRRRTCF